MCTISVAWDEAFLFYYEDNLDALRDAGAELLFFSPVKDERLPVCDGLYLGGGYPELYARSLSENHSMKESIKEAILNGLPAVAECGGFMYLLEEMRLSDGDVCKMAGVFKGLLFETGRAQRFGYLTIESKADSLLFRKGESIPAHEYHHWDANETGCDLVAKKADGRSWEFGYVSESLYAGFPHLHFGGEVPLAKRFVEAAGNYHENIF